MAKKMENTKTNAKGNKILQVICSILANCTIFTYGMQSGWMSPSIKILQSENSPSGYPLSDNEISWIASSLCILGFISSYFYSSIADKFGRKIAVMATSIPQALGWIIKLISAHPVCLIIARGLCGFGGAGCFAVAPLYTKEICDDSIRGIVGSMGMMMQSMGTLTMFAMGSYLDYYLVLWIAVWIPVLNTILMLIVAPESPAYLVKVGKIENAKETLARLMGVTKEDKTVITDIELMKNDDDYYKALPAVSFKSIFADKAWRKALWLAFLLMTALDVGGNFAIFTYASVIMSEAGVTVSPELQSLSFPAVMILGCILSMSCIERFGRKPLLLTCLAFTALPMATLATGLFIQNQGGIVAPWIPVVSIVVCVFCYGAGILPTPYVVMSEIFNFQIRAKLMGSLVAYGWFMCFVQLFSFTTITQALGMYTMFYIFAALNAGAIFILLIFLPETKGKSVDEIENILRGGPKQILS